MTYEQVDAEYRLDYPEQLDQYYCTYCKPLGSCPNEKCELITDNQTTQNERGLCCNAANIKENGIRSGICDGCEKWERHRIATILLGVRRFRADATLSGIHKDVLHYLVRIFILEKK